MTSSRALYLEIGVIISIPTSVLLIVGRIPVRSGFTFDFFADFSTIFRQDLLSPSSDERQSHSNNSGFRLISMLNLASSVVKRGSLIRSRISILTGAGRHAESTRHYSCSASIRVIPVSIIPLVSMISRASMSFRRLSKNSFFAFSPFTTETFRSPIRFEISIYKHMLFPP